MGLRPVPCAGLLVAMTRRCPLHCAHCSSSSTMQAAQDADARHLIRFVSSFSPRCRPDVLLLTGGEPLLRPGLVRQLAVAARRAGTRTALLTGAFFARRGRIPASIWQAIRAVDHFSVSTDAFHEREIPRAAVFATLRTVLDAGIPASLHLVGSGAADPYLADITAEVRRVFLDQVPMLVNRIRAVGRAASWASAAPAAAEPGRVLPCAMAAWPVVAFDGAVLACCNQEAVDRRPAPDHLLLGHIATDDWAAVRQRALASPVLRMIRTVGPAYLLAHYGGTPAANAGYCAGCRRLGDFPAAIGAATRIAAGPAGALLDQAAARHQADAGAVALVRRHGCAPYADLVALPVTGALAGARPGSARRAT